MIIQDEVIKALKGVMDPDLGRDIVSLNMVRDIRIEGNRVSFKLVLTTPACPMKARMEADARQAVSSIPGVKGVAVDTGTNHPAYRCCSRNYSAGYLTY